MLDRRTLLKSIPLLSAIPWSKAEVPAKPVVKTAAAPDPESLGKPVGRVPGVDDRAGCGSVRKAQGVRCS